MRLPIPFGPRLGLLVTLLSLLLAPGCTSPLVADPRNSIHTAPTARAPHTGSEPTSLFRSQGYDSTVPSVVNPKPDALLPREPLHFTQGLLVHRGKLYESTGGYGSSELLEWRLPDAELLRRIPLERSYFGEGLAVREHTLFQLTWTSGVCLLYDVASFEPRGSLFYPGEGWGLTHDPDRDLLVMSDGTAVLRLLDPDSFATRRQLTVRDTEGQPLSYLNELEWVRGEVWANLWTSERIARISPEDGRLLGWLDLSEITRKHRTGEEEVLNGIAYDPTADSLYLTGKLWPFFYRFDRVAERFFSQESSEAQASR